MACEVKTVGIIKDFHKIQEYFGLIHDDNWLNAVDYAISPLAEMIALAQGEKIALLKSTWDEKTHLRIYSLNWSGELENPNQIITSALCLPMYNKNSDLIPDWTCVVFGLNNGMLVFYNETGDKLYSQCFHEDVVHYIKALSPPKNIKADPILYVVYDKCVCYVNGSDFIPHLNNLNHNFHITKKCATLSNKVVSIEVGDVLQYEKIHFMPPERDRIINDASVITFQTPTFYDNIVEQCLCNGYNTTISEIPLQRSTILGVGSKPFLGFYYTDESYQMHTLGQVAKDVIGNACRNILGNIFGRPASSIEEQQEQLQYITPEKYLYMRNKCSFNDGKRDGYTISVSPGGRFAVVVDNLDRVMLIDAQRSIIKRVWKGYRDAQCGFIIAKERLLKGTSSLHRKAIFLVIYAPRLGCLEIWPIMQGSKVAAFTVSKSGQLAYNTHGLIGLADDMEGIKVHTNTCLYLDPSDQSIKTVEVPFHYTLSSTNAATSRDIDILRRMKNMLRDNEQSSMDINELKNLAKEFQTIEIRQQCIEMLLKSKHLKASTVQVVINVFDSVLSEQNNLESENFEEAKKSTNVENVKAFHIIVKNYQRLCNFYVTIQNEPEKFDEFEPMPLSENDMRIINQLVALMQNQSNTNHRKGVRAVKFDIGGCKTFGLVDFISIFQIDHKDHIDLIPQHRNSCGEISCHLFSKFFKTNFCVEDFKNFVKNSCISYDHMLLLVLTFWLEQPFVYTTSDEVLNDMSRLANAIRAICELAIDVVNNYTYQSISPWWQSVRELLLESAKCLSLLVAIVCKTIAKDLRKDFKENSGDEASLNNDEEKWEEISQDEAQWILLISKLEHIAILGAILENPMECRDPVMPKISYEIPDCSLKQIITGGQGIVTDLTSQWLINSCIHPVKIMHQTSGEQSSIKHGDHSNSILTTNENESRYENKIEKEDEVLLKLGLLREHYPFSLEPGILLTVMCWHYMIYWSKHLTSLKHFKASLVCLEQFHLNNYALKHGICCLLWQAVLKYPLQNASKLMHKIGRLPIDKMCQQDMEMSASNVSEFLEYCLTFIEHMKDSKDYETRELKFEETLTEGALSIQYLALQQQPAKGDLLKIYYELCTVLHFMAYFQFKFARPLTNLFDAMTNKAFFMDINKDLPFLLPAPDLALQEMRTAFLCKVIGASMDQIREDLDQIFIAEHMQYMDRIIALADSWCLNKRPLYRKQVVDLYIRGFDYNAECLLQNITEDEHIGQMLLEVAGRRLELYTRKSKESFLIVASVGCQLLQYLDNLNCKNTAPLGTETESQDINLLALIKLLMHATSYLNNEDSILPTVACQMLTACRLLQERQT